MKRKKKNLKMEGKKKESEERQSCGPALDLQNTSDTSFSSALLYYRLMDANERAIKCYKPFPKKITCRVFVFLFYKTGH